MKKTLCVLVLIVVLLTGCSALQNLSGSLYGGNFEVQAGSETYVFESFGEAWSCANENTNKEVVITCNIDIEAVDGNFGSYGELMVNQRTAPLTLDLNYHTVDRGLENPLQGGAVFAFMGNVGTVTIKNGTVTGGNKYSHGGGFCIDTDNLSLTLENITVTGNKSEQNGGGIYINGCNANVVLKDVTVTGNTASYGGGIHWEGKDGKTAKLSLGGKVVVEDNMVTGSSEHINFVANWLLGNTKLKLADFSAESHILFSFEAPVGMPLTDNLGDTAWTFVNCFESETPGLIFDVDENNAIFLNVDENSDIFAAGVYRADWGDYWQYFTSAAAAWNETDGHQKAVTMKLYKDWVSEKGNLGYGEGFLDGAMRPHTREMNDELTLDLNGYTINRGLTKETARDNGCIFVMSDGYSPHITVKNGTLTGGSNTDHGGAIDDRSDHGMFWLVNVTVKGNYSAEEGGAIYYYCDDNYLCLKDVTITENSQKSFSALYIEASSIKASWGTAVAHVHLYGNVKIKGNNLNNDLYVDSKATGLYVELSDDIEEGSIHAEVTEYDDFCVVGGNPYNALRAFTTNSATAHFYLHGKGGTTYLSYESGRNSPTF